MSLNQWCQRLWYQNHPLHYLLIPFAWLFQLIVTLRRYAYQLGLLRVTQLPVPVIVVGNLTVGGTGKTPCVIAIATWLQQQGLRPGIVSRGYKSRVSHYPAIVIADSRAVAMGDEPVLIAKRTGCPVIIDPDRARGARALVDQCGCNIIIADDGLQHYALGRDIEILVIDGQRRWGNGYCLPAGPLREGLGRKHSVDYSIATGVAADPEYCQTYQMGELINIKNPEHRIAIGDIGSQVHAVAGIGNPESFFNQLRAQGLTVYPHAFPDHAVYLENDLTFNDFLPIILTEKDAVKCDEFAQDNWFYQPITALLPQAFFSKLKSDLVKMTLHNPDFQLS